MNNEYNSTPLVRITKIHVIKSTYHKKINTSTKFTKFLLHNIECLKNARSNFEQESRAVARKPRDAAGSQLFFSV